MDDLILVRPSPAHEAQVMSYRLEMLQNGDSLDGCAGLEDVEDFARWLDFENRLRARYGAGYVPSEVFLALRPSDGAVVGIIDFRHRLSDFLFRYGGNIGYSVRPCERGKGYAPRMLQLMLEKCRGFGEKRVLVTCDKDNEASRRTILRCGGVLENEVPDPESPGCSGVVQRYWISL